MHEGIDHLGTNSAVEPVPAGSVWGVDVMSNLAIPEGVICVVPSGATLTDRRVRISAIDPCFLPAARRLAFQLAAMRDGKPGFHFSLPDEETL
ncbi:hypothetical protein AWH62_00830 [Maricaulis sp. W15]|uniref:hypothetical protein n=1 Tax=Maricaulis sp. W15 TaxID=1772333 RepID=UPI000948F021|nr:hypothetical protein [Maricaulis sp. W15]OLF81251.1 hypothetical protein AWH62_00830 [Maricaulis sp. W15]